MVGCASAARASAVSPGVTSGELLFSVITLTLVYAALLVVELAILVRYVRAGVAGAMPELASPESDDPDDPTRRDVLAFAAAEALRDDGQAFSCDLTPHGRNRRVFTRREPLLGGLHERAMEGCGHRERQRLADAAPFRDRDRAIDGRLRAGDHDRVALVVPRLEHVEHASELRSGLVVARREVGRAEP